MGRRIEEREPEEEQCGQDRIQESLRPSQEGVRRQRHPEVDQGRAAGEEGVELEGYGLRGWQNRSGPRLVRQGESALQGLRTLFHFCMIAGTSRMSEAVEPPPCVR